MKTQETSVAAALANITEQFAWSFPARAPAMRTVGREAEYPLVRSDGRAANVSDLWPHLLEQGRFTPTYDQGPDGTKLLTGVEGDGWSSSIEVGRSTVEISVGPRTTLYELEQDMNRGLGHLRKAAQRAGFHMLGFGIQPRTPAYRGILTPKLRYSCLLEAIGKQWLQFCVTAGDQLQVDVGQDDLVRLMNLVNAASGVIIAVTANSSVYGGQSGRFSSGREGLTTNMANEPYRHGAPARPYGSLEEYIHFLASMQCLCLPDSKGGFRRIGIPFTEYLKRDRAARDPGVAFEAFLFHEHYIWPSARPRSRIGTVEIRPACQQPPDSAWVPSALGLGLMEAADELETYLKESLGKDYWPTLQLYRRRAVKEAFAAPEPVSNFLDTVVGIAASGLCRRGYGEEKLLTPVRERIEKRSGPADEARAAFESGGAVALVQKLSLDR